MRPEETWEGRALGAAQEAHARAMEPIHVEGAHVDRLRKVGRFAALEQRHQGTVFLDEAAVRKACLALGLVIR